jgi:hypothetical protein
MWKMFKFENSLGLKNVQMLKIQKISNLEFFSREKTKKYKKINKQRQLNWAGPAVVSAWAQRIPLG